MSQRKIEKDNGVRYIRLGEVINNNLKNSPKTARQSERSLN